MLKLLAKIMCTVALLLVKVVVGCSPGWQFFGGNCYKFGASGRSFVGEPTTATWSDARLVCLSLGGDLVSIHTPAENAFVRRNSIGDTWIGMSQKTYDSNVRLPQLMSVYCLSRLY